MKIISNKYNDENQNDEGEKNLKDSLDDDDFNINNDDDWIKV